MEQKNQHVNIHVNTENLSSLKDDQVVSSHEKSCGNTHFTVDTKKKRKQNKKETDKK